MDGAQDDRTDVSREDHGQPVGGESSTTSGTSSPSTQEKRKGGRPASASPETRAEILALLASDNPPSLRSLETRYGVSRSTIHSWTNQQRQALTQGGRAGDDHSATTTAEATEREYRRRTRRALPVKERVRILREIAQGVPMTVECEAEHVGRDGIKFKCGNVLRFKLPIASASERLKALQRADELEGVVTAVQRREAEAGGGSQAQPLFALPAGAQLAVMVAPVRPPGTTTGGGQALPISTDRG